MEVVGVRCETMSSEIANVTREAGDSVGAMTLMMNLVMVVAWAPMDQSYEEASRRIAMSRMRCTRG